jgi:hypothetical protein
MVAVGSNVLETEQYFKESCAAFAALSSFISPSK